MTATRIDPDLLTAYRQADYVVQARSSFVLKVDEYSSSLQTLHDQYGVDGSAVITAWNPLGKKAPLDLNEQADRNLEKDLTATGCALLRCSGCDPHSRWPEEPGFLALGLSCASARHLGTRYQQNAILYCGSNAIPELILLR